MFLTVSITARPLRHKILPNIHCHINQEPWGLLVASRSHFPDKVAYRRPGCWGSGYLAGSSGLFEVTTVVHRAARDKPNSSSVESVPGYLGSMSVCGDAHWGKLSDSWPKSNSPTSTLRYCTVHNINSFSANNIYIYTQLYKSNSNNLFTGRELFGSHRSRQITAAAST